MLMSLLIALILTTSLFAQKEQVNLSYFTFKLPSPEALYESSTTAFKLLAPRNIMHPLNYGSGDEFKFERGPILNASIDESNTNIDQVADYTQIALVRTDGKVYKLGQCKMIDRTVLDPSTGGDRFTLSDHDTGWYYVKYTHKNSISVYSAIPFYFSSTGQTYDINIKNSDDVFGKDPLRKMPDGEYGLWSGDATLDDVVDLSDYISVWNSMDLTGVWAFQDMNIDGNIRNTDLNITITNWKGLRAVQSPIPNTDRVIQTPIDNSLSYKLLGKTIYEQGICYTDIYLSSEDPFILGAIQPIIRFNITSGITNYELQEEICEVSPGNQNFYPQDGKLELLFLLTPSDVINITSVPTKICRIKFTGTSYDPPINLRWVNEGLVVTKLAERLPNGHLLEMRNPDNHIVEDYLTSISNNTEIPKEFELKQNYPNPFNPTTNINFDLKEQVNVNLSVYNLLGEHILTLINDNLVAGSYNTKFDGMNLSSGTYYYKLIAGDFVSVKKMILIK